MTVYTRIFPSLPKRHSGESRQTAGTARKRRFLLRGLEKLEPRMMLAVANIIALPGTGTSGDGDIDVVSESGHTYGNSFSASAAAGYGPDHVKGRWDRSSGSFSISGPVTFYIAPEEGEAVGTPVVANLSFSFTATGGTGAGVFNGTTDVTYGATYQADGRSGVLLQPGGASPSTFNESPTSHLSERLKSTNTTLEFETEIGKTISVDLNFSGVSVSWQGGYTGASRGYVSAELAVELDVKTAQPNFVATGFTPNHEARELDIDYQMEGIFKDTVEGGLYWSTNDSYDPSDTKALDIAVSNQRGHHSEVVPLSALGTPPENARYLVFALDPFSESTVIGDVAEVYETDNDIGIPIYNEPTVIFGTNSTPYKNIDYGIFALITNNSLVEDEFVVSVSAIPADGPYALEDGSSINFVHQVLRGDAASGATTTTLKGMETRRIELQTVVDTWNWIPPKNPVTGVDALQNAGIEILQAAFGKVLTEFREISGKAFGIYDLVNDFVDALQTNVPSQPYYDLNYEVQVLSSFPTVVGIDTAPQRIMVPSLRHAYLDDFLAAYRAGGYALSQGAVLAVAGAAGLVLGGAGVPALAGGLGLMSYGITRLVHASDAYEKAFDPPDPNFREIPTATPPSITTPDDVAAIPILQALYNESLLAASLERAGTTARNRADGAQLANEPTWLAAQLEAASGLNTSAAVAYANYVGALAATSGFYSQLSSNIPAETFTHIATTGLPEEVVSLLQAHGYSTEAIDKFAEGLSDFTPSDVEDATGLDTTAVLGLANLSASAVDELAEAIDARVERLAQPVMPVADERLAELAADRRVLLDRLQTRTLKGTLVEDIAEHIEDIRQLILATNNLDALQDRLVEAYDLLVLFAKEAPSLTRLGEAVQQFADDAAIALSLAESVQNELNAAHALLSEGDFSATGARLLAITDLLSDGMDASSPESAAATKTLLGQTLYLYQYLTAGSLLQDVEAVNDDLLVLAGEPNLLDVMSNDEGKGPHPIELVEVFDAVGGAAVIDDGGTPGDFSDDRVRFVADADFHSGSFAYRVSTPGTPMTDVAYVTLRREFPSSSPAEITVNEDEEVALYFDGHAGEILYLNSDSPNFNSPAAYLTGPQGDTTYVGPGAFQLDNTGRHSIVLQHNGYDSSPETAHTSLTRLSTAPALTPGGTLELTVPPAFSEWNPTRDFFQIPEGAGGRVVLTPTDLPPGSRIELYVPYEYGGFRTEYLDGNGPHLLELADGPSYLAVTNTSSAAATIRLALVDARIVSHTLAYGETASHPISFAGESHRYHFVATAGDRVLIDRLGAYSGPLEWTLRSPAGEIIAGPSVQYAWNAHEVIRLPEHGEYQLEVRSPDASLRDIQFRLLHVDTVPEIGFGASRTVQLNTDEASLGNETAIFRFSASSPLEAIVVSESLLDGTTADSGEWTVLAADPEAPFLWAPTESLGMSFAASLPFASEYLLLIDSNTASPTALQFRLDDEPRISTTAAELGQHISSELSLPLEERHFEIDLAAGQLLLWEGGASTGDRKFASLAGPSGKLAMFTSTNRSLPFVVQESGKHLLRIHQGEESSPGQFAFRIVDLTAHAVELTAHVPLSTTVPAGEVRAISLSSTPNALFAVQATSGAQSGVNWSAYHSDGRRDAFLRSTTENMVVTTGSSGQAYVVVENPSESDVELEILGTTPSAGASSLEFGEDVYTSLTEYGQFAEFTFEVTSSTAVLLDSLDADTEGIFAEILSPAFDLLDQFTTDEDSQPRQLTEPGTYTLRVRGYEGRTGDFGFRLLNLADAPTVTVGQDSTGVLTASEVGDNPTRELSVYQFEAAPGYLYKLGEASQNEPMVWPETYSEQGEPVDWEYDYQSGTYFLFTPQDMPPQQYYLVIRGDQAETSDPTALPYGFSITEEVVTPPRAIPDEVHLRQGESADFDVLANDELSISIREVVVDSQPTHGYLYSFGGGSFFYEPDLSFAGTDSFTYRIIDRWGQTSAAATVDLIVAANQLPIAVDDHSSTGLNEDVFVAVLENDYDPDGELIGGGLEMADPPSQGSVVVVPFGTTLDDDSSPLGNGYASALSGMVGVSTELLVSAYPDYDLIGDHSESGSYSLFVKFGKSNFDDFAPLDFDRRWDRVLSAGTFDTIDISGDAAPGTPYIAWIDNSAGDAVTDTILAVRSEGGFLYRPDAGFVGTDAFTYLIRDEIGRTTAPATVRIIVGDPISAPSDTDGDGMEDAAEQSTVAGIDGNGDGIPDWEQSHVVNIGTPSGAIVIVVPEHGQLHDVKALPAVRGQNGDSQFPHGRVELEITGLSTGSIGRVKVRTVGTADVSAAFQVDQLETLHRIGEVPYGSAAIEDGWLVIDLLDGGSEDLDALANGTVRGSLQFALFDSIWQNPNLRYDVDASGSANPLDALLIINLLNRSMGDDSTLPPPISERGRRYYDVSGDQMLTPLDALQVINHLNRQQSGEGELALPLAGQAVESAENRPRISDRSTLQPDRRQSGIGEFTVEPVETIPSVAADMVFELERDEWRKPIDDANLDLFTDSRQSQLAYFIESHLASPPKHR